jgi:predicted molibdopterin-dependent oxidoreductase YjgC
VGTALKKGKQDAVLLLPHTLSDEDYATARELCESVGAKLNILLPDCNSWGAVQSGAHPREGGLDAKGILAAAQKGDIKLLYVMGSDPVAKLATPVKARFTVVQELFLTETAKQADVVLPASSFAEKDGTFINIEGREQKIQQAIAPKGESRPDWRIIADVLARLGTPMPYFSARDIYREWKRQA